MSESRRSAEERAERARRALGFALLAGLLALPSVAAAKTPVIDSAWRMPGDGDATRRVAATTLDKGRAEVSASNDDRYLYLTLSSQDRGLYASMFRDGLTLWIDPEGGHKKAFGIRYPLGGDAGARGVPLLPPAQVIELLEADGATPRRVLAGDVPGLEVRIEDGEDAFRYELKIPLVAADAKSFGLGAGTGQTVGIGWVTDRPRSGESSPERRGPGEGMGRHGGGLGGPMGGGLGGPMGGRMGDGMHGPEGRGGRPRSSVPLNAWVKVRLAAFTAWTSQVSTGD